MWIEIKFHHQIEVINTKAISKICLFNETVYLNYADQGYSQFNCKDEHGSKAMYEGIKLALQGMDFVFNSGEGYVKPLFASKNEALYRYMMQKEYIASKQT